MDWKGCYETIEKMQKIKEQAKLSLIRKYKNGYEAHWIDKHPRMEYYRNEECDMSAYPDEKVVVLNNCWCVVVFLNGIKELEIFEKEMHLLKEESYESN